MRYRTLLAAIVAALLTVACGSTPTGTNPVGTEGQTLGGYVASGAIDPEDPEGTETGDDDETPTGAPEDKKDQKKPPLG